MLAPLTSTDPTLRVLDQRVGEPERLLWLAVLERARHDIILSRTMKKAKKHLAWVLSDDTGIGTFTYVCSTLGISKGRMRKHFMQVYKIRKSKGRRICKKIFSSSEIHTQTW